jgi:hypothetical protein
MKFYIIETIKLVLLLLIGSAVGLLMNPILLEMII